MNPQFAAGFPPNFNNNMQNPSSGGFMPPPLNGAQHNANHLNANIVNKMQNMTMDPNAQQNGSFTNGPIGAKYMPPGQVPQGQLPPNGQLPPRQSNMMPPSSQQLPPSQLPPRQGMLPPGQLPPTSHGQLPPTQSLPSQLPPSSIPSPYLPPSAASPPQLPPRKEEQESGNALQQGSPGHFPPSKLPPTSEIPNQQQRPPSNLPPGAPPVSQSGQVPSSDQIQQSGQTPQMGQTPQPSQQQFSTPSGQPTLPGQIPPLGQPGKIPPFGQQPQPGQKPPIGPQSQPGHMPSIGQQSQPGQMPPIGQQSQPGQMPMPSFGQQLQPGQMPPFGQQPQPGQIPPFGQQPQPGQMPMPSLGQKSQPGQMPMPSLGQQPQPGQMPMPSLGQQPQPGQMPMPSLGQQPQPGQMPPSNQMSSNFNQMPPVSQGMSQPRLPPTQSRPNYPQMPPTSQPLQASNGFPSAQQPGLPGQPPKMGMPMMPPLPGQNASMVPPLPGQNAGMAPPLLGQHQPGYGGQFGMGGQQQPGYPQQPPQPGYPGAPQQMSYPDQQNQYGYQQTPKRLDPDLMPNPIKVIMDDQYQYSGIFTTNQKGAIPPLVTTDFTVEDQGNASPRYIRSSMYSVAATQDIIKQGAMPFCLVVSPMAETVGPERPPPLIDFAQSTASPGFGPVRCCRCKAYLCPNMKFLDAGRHFHCVFCKATTEVPMEYTQYLNNIQHYGQSPPELSLGCYEIVATKEYCRNNVLPQAPALIFCVDVSYNAVRCGMVQLVVGEIKNIISSLPPHQRIGIITYSSTIHFYNINEQLGQPQMLVVGDMNDVFVPLSHGLLVEPGKAGHLLDALAAEIPNMFRDNKETETVLLPAVQAGLEALKAAECVGKLIVFHSSLPTGQAPGKLNNRDDRKLLGTEKEKNVLAPQTKAYNELGQECVQAGCGVELFLFNSSYTDVATLGQLARLTGGTVYKYTYFQADLDGERFLQDLQRVLTRPTAYDAVMRVRTSTGIRATDFYGHFFMSNTTDVELATLDSDKAIGVEIKHDDKLTGEDGVYIQVALLYTHHTGQRRLRICNLALSVATQLADVYKFFDLDTIMNFLTKQAIWRLNEHPPKTIKEGIIARVAQCLLCYRKHCASPTSAGQLVLPESMKLLPLYANCLIRSDALSGGSDMSCDDRSWNMMIALSSDIATSVHYLYPTLSDVGPLSRQQAPQQLRCTAEKLTHSSVYLLDNTIHLLLWIGLQTPSDMLRQFFGVNTVQEVDTETQMLPVVQDPANKALRDYIDSVRVQRGRHMRLTIIRQSDKLETVFRHFLIEDQGQDGSPSYVDFLCHVHKEIRSLL